MNEGKFFEQIRRTLFAGKLSQAQVDGIKGLLTAFDQVGDRDQDTLAYGLATAFHETGQRMAPVREGFASSDAGARRAVSNLAKKRGPQSAVAKYAKPTGPYGHVYYGRGHVQLTWLENYAKCSKDAGADLVKDPDLMLDPTISARVLFRGVQDGRWNGQGKGIDFYEGEDEFLSDAEAAEARRTVNIKDKAHIIAGYHRKFYDALTGGGWKAKDGAKSPPTPHVGPTLVPGMGKRPPPLTNGAPEPRSWDEAKPLKVSFFQMLLQWLINLSKGRKK
jgi:hypothetical protein